MMIEQVSVDEQTAWPWPFSLANLLAGLRRFTQDMSLQIEEIRPRAMVHKRPAIGRLQGLRVTYRGKQGSGEKCLVVKEPRGSTRTGLAGAGRREMGVYQSLASQLPLRTPAFICADSGGNWLLLEELHPVREASAWTPEDYWQAIRSLASMHDRFWNLGEDLDAFPWVGKPLGADFKVHVTVAAQAIRQIATFTAAGLPTWGPERMRLLARLTTRSERVAAPLRRQPSTFLHGDYWPGNIAVLQDGSQAVYDWQLAAVGPAVLDLLVFIKKSRWWFGDLPVSPDALVAAYREEMKSLTGVVWDDEEWQELWDHALIWRFLQEWLDLFAASPGALLKSRSAQLNSVWLEPVTEAVVRRLEDS
ncbi:MAG TPA: aminoglycoside phosphotransferase family protein [Anaerolineae bacterium]|nr:aminoglycoside phosphotransferase family protein [Anaerolineae bacterium]